eukprot:gnl/TRDRNA2_/TRDRNA2_175159_c0_seq5.p1 gnl/TRDRNA2_/TRDRNA2_175159_c0~~gnl/TRDRNA2_/TRDRNA2_175159_c0_seq5.p1  ORF type:complete len:692 (+),score=116.01 gnl/TRDRNA2_/TRDRNA2_175159_c0_seq5:88-2163(+)
MSLVTCESLREELRLFAEETYQRELEALARRIQADLRAELKLFLQDCRKKLESRPGSAGWPPNLREGSPPLPLPPSSWQVESDSDDEVDSQQERKKKNTKPKLHPALIANKEFLADVEKAHHIEHKHHAPAHHAPAQHKKETHNEIKHLVANHTNHTEQKTFPNAARPRSPTLRTAANRPRVGSPLPPALSSDDEPFNGNRPIAPQSPAPVMQETTRTPVVELGTNGIHPMNGDTEHFLHDKKGSLVAESLTDSVQDVEEQMKAKASKAAHIKGNSVPRTSVAETSTVSSQREPVVPWYYPSSILHSTQMDYFIACVIFANAGLIGVQTELAWQHPDAPPGEQPVSVVFFDKLFTYIFIIELGLRFIVYRCGFWTQPGGWKWNWFDFGLVAFSVFEEIMAIIASGTGGADIGFMRVLRVLRLMRLLRIVRVMRYIGELRAIVMSIAGSMKSLLWTIALLFLIMYVIGILLCQLVTDSIKEAKRPDTPSMDADIEESLIEGFGGLPRTILSLYEAISGGKDWDDLCSPLIALHPLFGLLFAFYIAFSLLALMNVVTGVFVESALKSAKDDAEKSMLDSLSTVFCELSCDGSISWPQFQIFMDDPNAAFVLQSLDLVPDEAKALFSLMDVDDSGEIEYEEFLSGCLKLRGPARSMDLTTVMHEQRKNHRKTMTHSRKIEEMIEAVMRRLPKDA